MPSIPTYDFCNLERSPFVIKREGTCAAFSHTIMKVNLPDSSKTWISKEIADPAIARGELLAQEFFRVIIPHQPETRLAFTSITNTYYILSEEVRKYRDLPIGEAENFANGTYTGLGQVCACSMFLQEIDLKNGNLGVDEDGKVIKIDGDWCFAGCRGDEVYRITPEAIEKLPYPKDYYTWNWLDLIEHGVKKPASNIVNHDLTHSSQFRSEVNQAMLKICLMPDIFIDAFVDTYLQSGGQRYVDLIKNRRCELKMSALQNSSFREYLKSPEVNSYANEFLAHMKSFQARDVLVIDADQQNKLENDFNNMFARLKSSEELDECIYLIQKLESNLNVNDQKLKDYIEDKKQSIQSQDPENLCEIKEDLRKIHDSIASDEVLELKKIIENFRKKAGFFTIGMREKATKIEKALYNIPLDKRKNLISSPCVNEVQRELASHRHFFRSSPLTSSGEIDLQKSARSFRKFKQKIENLKSDSKQNKPGQGVIQTFIKLMYHIN